MSVCVHFFGWFTGIHICVMTWVWQRYYNVKVVYEDTANVPIIQKAKNNILNCVFFSF